MKAISYTGLVEKLIKKKLRAINIPLDVNTPSLIINFIWIPDTEYLAITVNFQTESFPSSLVTYIAVRASMNFPCVCNPHELKKLNTKTIFFIPKNMAEKFLDYIRHPNYLSYIHFSNIKNVCLIVQAGKKKAGVCLETGKEYKINSPKESKK